MNQFFGRIYSELKKELKSSLNEDSDRYSTDLFINDHIREDSSDHNIILTEAIIYILLFVALFYSFVS